MRYYVQVWRWTLPRCSLGNPPTYQRLRHPLRNGPYKYADFMLDPINDPRGFTIPEVTTLAWEDYEEFVGFQKLLAKQVLVNSEGSPLSLWCE